MKKILDILKATKLDSRVRLGIMSILVVNEPSKIRNYVYFSGE